MGAHVTLELDHVLEPGQYCPRAHHLNVIEGLEVCRVEFASGCWEPLGHH